MLLRSVAAARPGAGRAKIRRVPARVRWPRVTPDTLPPRVSGEPPPASSRGAHRAPSRASPPPADEAVSTRRSRTALVLPGSSSPGGRAGRGWAACPRPWTISAAVSRGSAFTGSAPRPSPTRPGVGVGRFHVAFPNKPAVENTSPSGGTGRGPGCSSPSNQDVFVEAGGRAPRRPIRWVCSPPGYGPEGHGTGADGCACPPRAWPLPPLRRARGWSPCSVAVIRRVPRGHVVRKAVPRRPFRGCCGRAGRRTRGYPEQRHPRPRRRARR